MQTHLLNFKFEAKSLPNGNFFDLVENIWSCYIKGSHVPINRKTQFLKQAIKTWNKNQITTLIRKSGETLIVKDSNARLSK